MSDTAPVISDPYLICRGDSLQAIAKRCGRSVADLKRFNKITNANNIQAGATLYLSERTAFGISVLFLDVLRHPIEKLPFKIEFDGKTITGVTDKMGQVLRQVTKSADSTVIIWVRNADGVWQQLHQTLSGVGDKLITLVSQALVIKAKTEPHPYDAPLDQDVPLSTKPDAPMQAPPPKPADGAPAKNNPHVKERPSKGKHGQPTIELSVDLPSGLMQLFQHYTGAKITDEEWKNAAKDLACEAEVLKAIAEVETKGAAFWKLNDGEYSGIVPAILYERHKFSKYTQHQYDTSHPDLSWKYGYIASKMRGHATLGQANNHMPDGKVKAMDQYGPLANSYLRLINAYRLDPDAALRSCSWGKFQIMGDEHQSSCGVSLRIFIKDMCASEVTQLHQLQNFIRHKAGGKLHAAVKAKDWPSIALYYNGKNYRDNNYDNKLKAAYDKFKNQA